MAAKGKKGSSASSETKAKARSWLSSITKSGEERATEAVAPPAEARTVATPESIVIGILVELAVCFRLIDVPHILWNVKILKKAVGPAQ